MVLSFFHGSGIVIITARGSGIPDITMNSRALSRRAESEPFTLIAGSILYISFFSTSQLMLSSRASILSALPVMVFISPLCTIKRFG